MHERPFRSTKDHVHPLTAQNSFLPSAKKKFLTSHHLSSRSRSAANLGRLDLLYLASGHDKRRANVVLFVARQCQIREATEIDRPTAC